MRVLLISLNEETIPDPVFPLGLACLAGSLSNAGHDYRIFDLNLQTQEELPGLINSFDPQAVGISIRNIDDVSYPNSTIYLQEFKNFCLKIRQLTSSPLILGGSGYSLYPGQLLQELQADYGIIGEGEIPLLHLLQCLQAQEDIKEVPNLIFRQGSDIRQTNKQLLPLPPALPRREGLSLQAYMQMGGMANLQTKRGCPFKCIYCSYPLIEGQKSKLRPIDSVIHELQLLVEQGFDQIFFVDSVFNQPPEYSRELCRRIIQERIPITWTCYAIPAGLDREDLLLYKKSGCLGLEFGTDSLCSHGLQVIGKSFDQKEVQKVSSLCRELELPFCHSIIAGWPGETKEDLLTTVKRLEGLKPTAVIFMTGIRIIPGTALEQIALKEGYLDQDSDLLQPVFYISKSLPSDLDTIVQKIAKRNKNWIFPGYSIRHSKALAAKLRKFGAKGPLWLNFARKKP